VAEIGDVYRFPSPQTLCSWAGLTPKHKESDVKVARGNITKMACGLPRLTGRLSIPYGGDDDDYGRARHPLGSTDLTTT
jgi:Transposase IS116/IS110/IS902 family